MDKPQTETNAMEKPIIKCIQLPHAKDLPLPSYQTQGAAGMDVRVALTKDITLAPGERALVPTGIIMAIPQGYEVQIRPRSGLAIKHGITMVNSPGTIDSDFRGEIYLLVINHGQQAFTLKHGDRMAQMAAAGGLGQIFCQWANAIGCEVIGTVSSKEKEKIAKENGCHHVINYKENNFVEEIKKQFGENSIDVVYDGVGETTYEGSMEVLKVREATRWPRCGSPMRWPPRPRRSP